MSYSPTAARAIVEAQNQEKNLRLLLAQRRLYSRAKLWATVRAIGVGVVAVGAPIAGVIMPEWSAGVGTVAAAWFVLNRLLFRWLERQSALRGAVVQEMFDLAVFAMPTLGVREVRVLPEEIARIVGGPSESRAAFQSEKLTDWYPVDTRQKGAIAVALAQRANAAYSQSLLGYAAGLWLGLLGLWAVAVVAVGVSRGSSLTTFLLTIALPVLPPLLDAWDLWVEVRAAGRQRRALAAEIEDAVRASKQVSLEPQQLLAWQSQLYLLRRDSPQVPNCLYRALRPRLEREMSEAADTLGLDQLADGDSTK